ncbi:hypothetical protein BASA60_006646 [Batrachochytrium salamandrivorans]|nr:hypothetical protein BASA60_006646 [Batrachochytrium salamandrivorans]KAH6575978.1 hypothetical protein BASA62_001687 [Batrachochytrium salamandrivorans]KAH9252299.1 hypothetical protein BASA81_009752 [Batrachochytrium salamandrivorans]
MALLRNQSDSLATLVDEHSGQSASVPITSSSFTGSSKLGIPEIHVNAITLSPHSLQIAPAPLLISASSLSTKPRSSRSGPFVPCISEKAPQPRRRGKDSASDYADGLDLLVHKSRAVNLNEDQPEITALGEDGEKWVLDLCGHSGKSKLDTIRKIRKYVCGEKSEVHAQNLIASPVLQLLMWLLAPDTPESELFETLWILTNIAAGPTAQTTKIVELGFLPHIVRLLGHPSGSIRTQAAWALGNVVGDREGFRDRVLQEGTLPAVLTIWHGDFSEESSRKEAFRIAMWVVDNMCRYKPDWHQMAPAFEALPKVLNESDPFLLKECCWAIARILHQSGRHPAIDGMITKDLCCRLIEILHFNNMLTTHPILRALINLSSSKNPVQVQYIVDGGLLFEMSCLLSDDLLPRLCRSSLQVFAMQILGNIASQERYIDNFIKTESLLLRIVQLLGQRENSELSVEACICLRNLSFHRNDKMAKALVNLKVIQALVAYLKTTLVDSKYRLATVEALGYILEVGDAIGMSAGIPLISRIKNRRHIAAKYKGSLELESTDSLVRRSSKPALSSTTPSNTSAILDSLSKPTTTGAKVMAKRNRGRNDLGNLEDLDSADDSPATTPKKSNRGFMSRSTTSSRNGTNNPFISDLKAANGFQVLLDALVSTSGLDLDRMDEDGPDEDSEIDSDDEGGNDGLDSEDAAGCATQRGTGNESPTKTSAPVFSVRQSSVSRLHTVLMRWFPEAFQERIRQAHETSLMMASMGGLSVGTQDACINNVGAFEGALLDLVRDFGRMKSEGTNGQVPVHLVGADGSYKCTSSESSFPPSTAAATALRPSISVTVTNHSGSARPSAVQHFSP